MTGATFVTVAGAVVTPLLPALDVTAALIVNVPDATPAGWFT